MGALGLLPLVFIPKRYLIVAGLWGAVGANSPFFMSIAMALAQLGLEYGIIFERKAPAYMTHIHEKLLTVWMPRMVSILSWIPYVNRYLPTN